MKQYWFPVRPASRGWGWGLPLVWHGWAVYAVFFAALTGGLVLLAPYGQLATIAWAASPPPCSWQPSPGKASPATSTRLDVGWTGPTSTRPPGAHIAEPLRLVWIDRPHPFVPRGKRAFTCHITITRCPDSVAPA